MRSVCLTCIKKNKLSPFVKKQDFRVFGTDCRDLRTFRTHLEYLAKKYDPVWRRSYGEFETSENDCKRVKTGALACPTAGKHSLSLTPITNIQKVYLQTPVVTPFLTNHQIPTFTPNNSDSGNLGNPKQTKPCNYRGKPPAPKEAMFKKPHGIFNILHEMFMTGDFKPETPLFLSQGSQGVDMDSLMGFKNICKKPNVLGGVKKGEVATGLEARDEVSKSERIEVDQRELFWILRDLGSQIDIERVCKRIWDQPLSPRVRTKVRIIRPQPEPEAAKVEIQKPEIIAKATKQSEPKEVAKLISKKKILVKKSPDSVLKGLLDSFDTKKHVEAETDPESGGKHVFNIKIEKMYPKNGELCQISSNQRMNFQNENKDPNNDQNNDQNNDLSHLQAKIGTIQLIKSLNPNTNEIKLKSPEKPQPPIAQKPVLIQADNHVQEFAEFADLSNGRKLRFGKREKEALADFLKQKKEIRSNGLLKTQMALSRLSWVDHLTKLIHLPLDESPSADNNFGYDFQPFDPKTLLLNPNLIFDIPKKTQKRKEKMETLMMERGNFERKLKLLRVYFDNVLKDFEIESKEKSNPRMFIDSEKGALNWEFVDELFFRNEFLEKRKFEELDGKVLDLVFSEFLFFHQKLQGQGNQYFKKKMVDSAVENKGYSIYLYMTPFRNNYAKLIEYSVTYTNSLPGFT